MLVGWFFIYFKSNIMARKYDRKKFDALEKALDDKNKIIVLIKGKKLKRFTPLKSLKNGTVINSRFNAQRWDKMQLSRLKQWAKMVKSENEDLQIKIQEYKTKKDLFKI